MPKLNKGHAKETAEAKSTFEPLPEGVYPAKLEDVTVKEGPRGDYWSWEFSIVGGEFNNRKMWVSTSLAKNALWKLKEVFDAFGADTGTDTDELVGSHVLLGVKQRVQDAGARKGEIGNEVTNVRMLPEDYELDDDNLGGNVGDDDIY